MKTPYKPRPTKAQIAKVRAAMKSEIAAAQAAINGSGGSFADHMAEVRVMQSWIDCYVTNR